LWWANAGETKSMERATSAAKTPNNGIRLFLNTFCLLIFLFA
jgi:hypothetical protein